MDAKDTERLASLDIHGNKREIIPAEVKGYFRKHRDWTQVVLILIFLIVPWLKINGNQAILLNIGERKFSILGTMFYAHDVPKLFFILFAGTLSLVFVTSVWGRIWCGWACPQTVFMDGVFRKIEYWIEGNYIKRRQLNEGPWTHDKIIKRILKYFAFFAVSSITAHSFAAYFVGAHEIILMIQNSPLENSTTFGVVSFLTAIMFFDFVWFKEQVCVIMCPYGRFQSVLMDQNSLAIIYDEKRGEPRKGSVKEGQKQGDCVNCGRCVQVCPTGIDIRKGVQMDCITCTSCIDACDDIMEKLKKPKGLIRYDSVSRKKATIFNIRSMIYLGLIVIAIIGLIISLKMREDIEVVVLRAKEEPYQLLKTETGEDVILNHFRLHIKNQSEVDGIFAIESMPDQVSQSVQMTIAQNPVSLPKGKDITIHIFAKFKKELLTSGRGKAQIKVKNDKASNIRDLDLVGPQ